MKNYKKEKFPLSVIPSAGDCAMESFFCVATIAFIGGILVFIKWIWISDSHTAWIHVKPWWYLLMATYAIGSLFKILNRISIQLQEVKDEISKQ